MSDRPSSPAFSSPTPDTGTGVPRLEAWLKADKQSLWSGLQALTISSGSITPADGVTGSIIMDTEGAASTDILDVIGQTNIPDGHAVCLQIADNGRVITINHLAGGTGQIDLTDGLDFEMNRIGQRLILQREGTKWVEVGRFGREKEHQVGGSGEPAYLNSWTAAPNVYFWKDALGVVHLRGVCQKTSVAVAASEIFNLPAGYRPSANMTLPLYASVAGASDFTCFLVIKASTGAVEWNRSAAPLTVTVGAYLNSISFRAEA